MSARLIFMCSAVLGVALHGMSCKSPSGVEAPRHETGSEDAPRGQTVELTVNAPEGQRASPSASASVRPHCPYPPGQWRAHQDELERIVLWPSHLLIRYAGVAVSDSVSFSTADFRVVLPPATRTREQALALATELARRARDLPSSFAQLVHDYSEDPVSREAGGSLGGIPASQLTLWPEILDALSELEPSEVSDPVETWYGFHILMRHAPPAEDIVTGRRIVIGHADAGFSKVVSGVVPTRSAAEARALADRIYAEATDMPERFPELVSQHSEARDRVRRGDFGTWSNREPAPFPRAIEVLDSLQVGEVARPFDSLFGVEIVQRVANRPRPVYAIDGLRLYFDPEAPSIAPNSRDSVHALAGRYTRDLLESSTLLAELQSRHPRYTSQWIDGRGSPEVEAAVAAVAPGEFLREPARAVSNYVIGRRIEPHPQGGLEPSFELP